MIPALPSGTVTFLFTDIEGSTTLAQTYPDALPQLLARHNAILRDAIESNHGHVFRIVGDAFCAAFPTPGDGFRAALMAQRALQHEPWNPVPVLVRMGVNTGDAQARSVHDEADPYVGYLTLTRAQRVMSTAHGGQILLSHTTAELLRDALPAELALRDMGEHKLKGLVQAETLWQVMAPRLKQEFAPLQTLDVLPNNLPIQLTSFIGRERELDRIKELLSKTRLLTLTGAGGSGKTRLSLQVAANVIDEFENGAWFVELAPLADPALVPQSLASVLSIREQVGRSLAATLADYLRAKNLLLILDNCEHLLEACAQLATTLLRACPRLKILATSREALGIAGEAVFHVRSLTLPDPQQLPAVASLAAYDAVRLFVDRAVAIKSDFQLTDANASAVVQICQRVDGIPLALELAAARVKSLSVEDIAARLHNQFRLLTGGSRTALPRQQTLRALIDWSYNLLTEPERVLFRRISVFAGGWTLQAAEQVCSGDGLAYDDVVDVLDHLVSKSLVMAETQSGETRYRLLETIRQYAREKLFESGEGEQVRNRHLAYFKQLTQEYDRQLHGAGQRMALRCFEREHDNARAAFDWAMDNAQVESALELCADWGFFWFIHNHIQEGLVRSNAVLARPESAARTAARAVALFWRGGVLQGSSGQPYIRPMLDESISIARELGPSHRTTLAFILAVTGILLERDDQSVGQPLLDEALALGRELGDAEVTGYALAGLGEMALRQADAPRASVLLTESLAELRKLDHPLGIAYALTYLGTAQLCLGAFEEARANQREALSLFQEIGEVDNTFWLGAYLARSEELMGNFTEARSILEQRLVNSRQLGSKHYEASALDSLGNFARRQKDFHSAVDTHQAALKFYRELNNRNGVAHSLENLARVYIEEGKAEAARGALKESLAGLVAAGLTQCIPHSLQVFAQLALQQNQNTRAARLFGAAESLAGSSGVALPPLDLSEFHQSIANARAELDVQAWAQGRVLTPEQAIEYALEAKDA